MKLPPAAAYASRTANEVSRSAVQPKTFPPRQSRDTSRSLVPIFATAPTLRPASRIRLAMATSRPPVAGSRRAVGTGVEALALSWVECQRTAETWRSGTRDDGAPQAVIPDHLAEAPTPRGGTQVANIKPLEDKIVVQASEAETTTASGIVIPDTAKEKPQEGKVLAVGPGRIDDNGNRVPLDVAVGDVVIYSKYGGTEVKYNGEEYLILSARDVLAVVN